MDRGKTMNSPAERGVTTISTTPHQALSGTPIGPGPMAQCSSCARSTGVDRDQLVDHIERGLVEIVSWP